MCTYSHSQMCNCECSSAYINLLCSPLIVLFLIKALDLESGRNFFNSVSHSVLKLTSHAVDYKGKPDLLVKSHHHCTPPNPHRLHQQSPLPHVQQHSPPTYHSIFSVSCNTNLHVPQCDNPSHVLNFPCYFRSQYCPFNFTSLPHVAPTASAQYLFCVRVQHPPSPSPTYIYFRNSPTTCYTVCTILLQNLQHNILQYTVSFQTHSNLFYHQHNTPTSFNLIRHDLPDHTSCHPSHTLVFTI